MHFWYVHVLIKDLLWYFSSRLISICKKEIDEQKMFIYFLINSFYKVVDLMELNISVKHSFKDKNRYQEWQCSKISFSQPISWKPTLLGPAITRPYFASLRIWYGLEYALERIDVWLRRNVSPARLRSTFTHTTRVSSRWFSDCLTNPITFIDLRNCL